MLIIIEQVMVDLDWIGLLVEKVWWLWNSQQVEYQFKCNGSLVCDIFCQLVVGGVVVQVVDDQCGILDVVDLVYDCSCSCSVFVCNGDVFVCDLCSGVLIQFICSNECVGNVNFVVDNGVIWCVGQNWFYWIVVSGVQQVVSLKVEKDLCMLLKVDVLCDQQLCMLEILCCDCEQCEVLKDQDQCWCQVDLICVLGLVYLGVDVEIVDSVLLLDFIYLIVVIKLKDFDDGCISKMLLYVIELGYEEIEDICICVGCNGFELYILWYVDVCIGKVEKFLLVSLLGISIDLLVELCCKVGKDVLKGECSVQVMSDFMGGGICWSVDGQQVVVMLCVNDNKDCWIISVNVVDGCVQNCYCLIDNVWINWGFNDFGWMVDGCMLWLLFEELGFLYLYIQVGIVKLQVLISGKWEILVLVLLVDGKGFYFLCNQQVLYDYEVCVVDIGSCQVCELISFNGVEDFLLLLDGQQLLVCYFGVYLLLQLVVLFSVGG